MITLEKGTIEYIFVPVEVEGTTPDILPLLQYRMAVHPLGSDPTLYWQIAVYSPETQCISALVNTNPLPVGDYRLKVKVTEAEEAPMKDCGIVRIR